MPHDAYRKIEAGTITIRVLREDDLPDVLNIECQGYSFPWSESVFRGCFRPDYRLWALDMGDRLSGYAVVAYMAGEAHLLNLCVAAGQRRSGAGRHLLRHLVAESARDGMSQVLLEVRDSNASALDLYVSEGFSVIGRRPGYYPGGQEREDALVMALPVDGRSSAPAPP
ncbi:ribosomal-protein-alanine N-acetyltransferase [Marinobacter panjinensis]|uniref:[Ribosomal protein bS18]-alanine N-acetyltransferase n=1 Tax=Marinobacter panjinensis TaxID=2576384 RepID=A0A4U6QT46_9GAMM|nr:ribosomal protein S18-alanine N-acetyltransferase [Marinobacter panjinensis]MCR8914737.1 ribosomal protein S18-alanine N-acetyltransferase [Marinobacter panjinensis]TKV63993.1 ribosomal-protein-alanine N-acetyltransferase [Marinobacter panjinensis]